MQRANTWATGIEDWPPQEIMLILRYSSASCIPNAGTQHSPICDGVISIANMPNSSNSFACSLWYAAEVASKTISQRLPGSKNALIPLSEIFTPNFFAYCIPAESKFLPANNTHSNVDDRWTFANRSAPIFPVQIIPTESFSACLFSKIFEFKNLPRNRDSM